MNFKDCLEKDIANIFFSFEEFGEEHTISGHTAICILDEDRFEAKQRKGLLTTDDGVFLEGMTIYIPSKTFRYRPHVEEKITIDGKKYDVISCKEDMGILELDVARYEER
ncbi:MAG TPA: hypothetical protein VIG61_08980 [Fusobacterium sp.]|uniref:hypothetical protein n=1 Tax=Fusobacterium sp. TaxID=68766 RepID=UPI002F4031FB